jgi:hypothetical protein
MEEVMLMSVAAILTECFNDVEDESSVPFHECQGVSVGSEDDMINYLDNKYNLDNNDED